MSKANVQPNIQLMNYGQQPGFATTTAIPIRREVSQSVQAAPAQPQQTQFGAPGAAQAQPGAPAPAAAAPPASTYTPQPIPSSLLVGSNAQTLAREAVPTQPEPAPAPAAQTTPAAQAAAPKPAFGGGFGGFGGAAAGGFGRPGAAAPAAAAAAPKTPQTLMEILKNKDIVPVDEFVNLFPSK